jgi:uncharacterized protein (DUF433 family)
MTSTPLLDDCSLGIGLYTPAEAAMYARITTRTMGRWVFGDATGDAAFPHQIESGEPTVSFLDFVQALAVRAIRHQFGVSLQKIRAAVDCVQQTHGILYPFAREHETYVIMDGSAAGELAIKINGHTIQISGKHKKQHLLGPVAELYMERVTFGPNGLASEYRAWGTDDDPIRMNPHLRFGEPLVTNCGYSARVLWEAVKNEGSIKDAALAYGVDEKHIRLACEYIDHLTSRDVA